MPTLQHLRPMTRARMARLSLPDIRAYAKAYKVPADVIECGTVDELLDFIFELRPPHPEEYPINTPHLFARKIVRTRGDRDEEPLAHKPYTGFAHRRNLASIRRGKGWTGRPSPFEQGGQVGQAADQQYQVRRAEDESHGDPNKGTSPAPTAAIPSNEGPTPYLRLSFHSLSPVFREATRGGLPPPPGFEVADDLSNLGSVLEEHGEPGPEPSRIIVDDQLFDLEFTPDMTRAGKEAITCERHAIATSNRKMIMQIFDEAEAEAKQALWQLTTSQHLLDAVQENMRGVVNKLWRSTNRRGWSLIRKALSDSERLAKEAWELEWNEEWGFTEGDDRMEEITRARAAGVQVPHSTPPTLPHSPSRKRVREGCEDELEYVDEGEPRAGTRGPDRKRPRVESCESSTASSSPSPKRKDKGKGRNLVTEDSHTLPFSFSSFRIPPSIPRFGPEDRFNVYPMYNPAVPGYETRKPSEVNESGEKDGGHSGTGGDGSNDGPEPDPDQAKGQKGKGRGRGGVGGAEMRNQNGTQIALRGAPSHARQQPKVPQPGDPWQVLRYDRLTWGEHITTDYEQMPSELKRPVNWSVMGSHHPKGANYRERDDGLEERNPWNQGGRPISKQ